VPAAQAIHKARMRSGRFPGQVAKRPALMRRGPDWCFRVRVLLEVVETLGRWSRPLPAASPAAAARSPRADVRMPISRASAWRRRCRTDPRSRGGARWQPRPLSPGRSDQFDHAGRRSTRPAWSGNCCTPLIFRSARAACCCTTSPRAVSFGAMAAYEEVRRPSVRTASEDLRRRVIPRRKRV
jgi:hypothetical protein